MRGVQVGGIRTGTERGSECTTQQLDAARANCAPGDIPVRKDIPLYVSAL